MKTGNCGETIKETFSLHTKFIDYVLAARQQEELSFTMKFF